MVRHGTVCHKRSSRNESSHIPSQHDGFSQHKTRGYTTFHFTQCVHHTIHHDASQNHRRTSESQKKCYS
eukprot:m.33878 g.33878  ORF g.33878 m.33878 type:complete len:69 (-) comp14266_c0_seq1:31-237(-)